MIELEQDNFKVEMSFLARFTGRTYCYFKFWDLEFRREPLFSSGGFCVAEGKEPESIIAIADLIGFLSCTKEDVEADYFKDYNQTQREWLQDCDWRLETLKQWQFDLEALGEVADELYFLSNDDDYLVAWDMWKDEGFPVRLQYFEESYKLFFGDCGFDINHYGYWAASSISEGMSEQECWNLAVELQEICLERQARGSLAPRDRLS